MELQGGNGVSTGNVFAVNRNGYFGPVCDDHWTDTEADTVCRYISLSFMTSLCLIFYSRQLGFDRGTHHTESHFGNVPSDFAMDSVDCSITDYRIQDCSYSTSEDCGSSEGAGVSCY